MKNPVKSPVEFTQDIEVLVREKKIDYFEAIMIYAEIKNLEIETVASLVKQNQIIKAKLADECESLNLIEKTNKLPI